MIPGDTPVNDVGSVLKVLDGILLTGGDDIDLQPLGGPSPPKTSKPIPLAQQTLSIALMEAAREQRARKVFAAESQVSIIKRELL